MQRSTPWATRAPCSARPRMCRAMRPSSSTRPRATQRPPPRRATRACRTCRAWCCVRQGCAKLAKLVWLARDFEKPVDVR
eukprot:6155378-Alexandrium_andersonii.AAC.1